VTTLPFVFVPLLLLAKMHVRHAHIKKLLITSYVIFIEHMYLEPFSLSYSHFELGFFYLVKLFLVDFASLVLGPCDR